MNAQQEPDHQYSVGSSIVLETLIGEVCYSGLDMHPFMHMHDDKFQSISHVLSVAGGEGGGFCTR